jgi:hypothetical protein
MPCAAASLYTNAIAGDSSTLSWPLQSFAHAAEHMALARARTKAAAAHWWVRQGMRGVHVAGRPGLIS